jgi:hypothetical protein
MISGMVTGEPDLGDAQKFYAALRRAQQDIDLRSELYTHYYLNELPERFHDMIDARRMGPGERIVFEPYTADVFQQSQEWIAERDIFEGDGIGGTSYDEATVSLAR